MKKYSSSSKKLGKGLHMILRHLPNSLLSLSIQFDWNYPRILWHKIYVDLLCYSIMFLTTSATVKLIDF